MLNIAEAWAAQSDAEIAKEVASLVAKAPAVQEVLDSTPNVLRQAALDLLAEAAVGQGGGKEQPGVGHQPVVVEGDLDAVGVVAW